LANLPIATQTLAAIYGLNGNRLQRQYRNHFSDYQKFKEEQQRAVLLFERYPELEKAYGLATDLGNIYRQCTSKEQAFKHLALWYNKVEDAAIASFRTVARSIQQHYINILNFFNNRTTNANAESFNAKIKNFRAQFRGVKDKNFFLFRLTKLYA
jgi:transposase